MSIERQKTRPFDRKVISARIAEEDPTRREPKAKKTRSAMKPYYGKRGMVQLMGPGGEMHWEKGSRKKTKKRPSGRR